MRRAAVSQAKLKIRVLYNDKEVSSTKEWYDMYIMHTTYNVYGVCVCVCNMLFCVCICVQCTTIVCLKTCFSVCVYV